MDGCSVKRIWYWQLQKKNYLQEDVIDQLDMLDGLGEVDESNFMQK